MSGAKFVQCTCGRRVKVPPPSSRLVSVVHWFCQHCGNQLSANVRTGESWRGVRRTRGARA